MTRDKHLRISTAKKKKKIRKEKKNYLHNLKAGEFPTVSCHSDNKQISVDVIFIKAVFNFIQMLFER